MLKIDGPVLHPEITALIDAGNFAAVSTLLPDGQPQTQVVWIDRDGDDLLINTPIDTQKHRNVRRDPRITVMIWDRNNPFAYGEVRGRVTAMTSGEPAWEQINRLSQRYFGGPYQGPRDRVLLRIVADRQLLSRPPGG